MKLVTTVYITSTALPLVKGGHTHFPCLPDYIPHKVHVFGEHFGSETGIIHALLQGRTGYNKLKHSSSIRMYTTNRAVQNTCAFRIQLK
ncbi:unnamed protein product [Allacma fusca]|uniref:Uncharacterized protein n=1 Tax=Allacma fusca TaxID=39272 RepID=A0A8J2KKJ1_9HEXA|nr:unnamed protein product [Allacma fusca]